MIGNYKVITLCGSTRFEKEYHLVEKELTLLGYIVISSGVYGHAGDNSIYEKVSSVMPQSPVLEKFKASSEMLDDMHRSKIDIADEIFVINPNGYIGDSTKKEVAYALSIGKKVNYLES